MHTNTDTHLHVNTGIHTCAQIPTHAEKHVCAYTGYIQVYIHTNMPICICIDALIWMHTQTFRYTYSHICTHYVLMHL